MTAYWIKFDKEQMRIEQGTLLYSSKDINIKLVTFDTSGGL